MRNFILGLLFIAGCTPAFGGVRFNDVTIENTCTLPALTANTVPYLDGSKEIKSSAVSTTELGYLSGVTSAIQTQFSGKQDTLTGAATSIASSNLTASRAVVSDVSGKIDSSNVTATELGFLSGVTSAIQTQINDTINKLLTAYSKVVGPNTVTSSDSILTALQKIDGNTYFGVPAGVFLNNANKVFITPHFDGLKLRMNDSVTQTNAAGGFNGSGTGNAGFVSISQLDGALANTFSGLSLTALVERDADANQFGQMSFNILVNFANGVLPTATDFANIVYDNLPNTSYNYFPLTSSPQTFTVGVNDHAFRAVSGTGIITVTGNVTAGSAVVTNISNINALTAGMFFRQAPAQISATPETGMAFPIGTTIVSINVPGTSVTLSNVSANTATGVSFRQYGGVAPLARAGGLTSGSAVVTGITNTADLQVNMKVTGNGVPANTRIISMVANTSITLSANATSTGTETLSFQAQGLTGIPPNTDYMGLPWSRIVENNPSMVFSKTTPITPTWTNTDGGFAKSVEFPAINLKMGGSGSSNRTPRQVSVRSMVLNGTTYKFAH